MCEAERSTYKAVFNVLFRMVMDYKVDAVTAPRRRRRSRGSTGSSSECEMYSTGNVPCSGHELDMRRVSESRERRDKRSGDSDWVVK